ncbi:VOC family protein [Cellulomonas shaoxiangyii]|uniref:VOC family protein n=1 Tax=Cellulomonas shaoxiangyii TaxID=2566013 RepID=A0A4P7SL01_9CELL|nr:VOC family protein [Cellulomonas shaoxiangyii]QCB93223.1 VOC family protein [Cellulomonas shaoxiangyii]TGY77125.1 VOC family protein [Cellulomonas shaoxiangyii]
MPTAPVPGAGADVPLAPRPAREPIAAGTAMDAVTLLVDDLDLQLRYYRDVLGLTVLEGPGDRFDGDAGGAGPVRVALGRRGVPVVVLQHAPGLPPRAAGSAGLFHTALLFDDRAGLAATLASVARHAPHTYVGSADHLVSLAFYLTDPEGNGVELYWDRSRDRWQRAPGGGVLMDALRLDPHAFLREHLVHPEPAGDDAAVVGHVHLQVGDVAAARGFYVDALGFEVQAEWHGALFVAAGGYHHHLAVNTWGTAGAGPRASSLGLGEVRVVVPTVDDLGALRERVRSAGVVPDDDGATLRFADPWRNVVRVSARETHAA